MTDVAADLKDRFFSAELWFREKWEMYGVNPDGKYIPDVLTDEEMHAINVFMALRDSVDEIPPTLIKTTEELRTAVPEKFEETLVHGMQVVGFGFYPTSATE